MTKIIQVELSDDDYTDDGDDNMPAYGRNLTIDVELVYKKVSIADDSKGPVGQGLELTKVNILYDTGCWFPTDQDGGELPDFPYENTDWDEAIIDDATEQFNSGKLAL